MTSAASNGSWRPGRSPSFIEVCAEVSICSSRGWPRRSRPGSRSNRCNVRKYTPNTTLHPVALGEAANGTARLQLFASQAARQHAAAGADRQSEEPADGCKGRSDELEVAEVQPALDDYAR